MKKSFIIIGLVLLFGVQSTKAFSEPGFLAQSLSSTSGCVVPKVNGERVPFPLQKANTKFELSENETYLLNGSLFLINSNTYFKVDFNSQPWLATDKLLHNPYFLIDSMSIAVVARMGGRIVQVAVVARRNVQPIEEGGHPLKLQSIFNPAAF